MRLALLAALLLLSACAVGLLLGRARTVEEGVAAKARQTAERDARGRAARTAREEALLRGRDAGLARGRREGRRRGVVRGKAQREADARAQAAQSASAAEDGETQTEGGERARNCGAPLFAEGACPSDEEIEAESSAESLCGGGDYAEAKEQGIACFPPGDPRNP